jgi:hypothetical protein
LRGGLRSPAGVGGVPSERSLVVAEVIVLSPEQLQTLVREAVAAGIRDAGVQSGAGEWLPVTSCGLPEKTVRRAIKDGAVEGRIIGRALYARRASLEAWAAERPSAERHESATTEASDPVKRALAAGRLRVVPAAAGRAER